MCIIFFNNWFDWFFNNGSKGFPAKLRFAFSEAASRFSTSLWTRRTVLKFMMSCEKFEMILECFWNAGEFNHYEFTTLSLNNSWMEWMRIHFCFPLPLPRRQSQKERDTTQCMLHEQLTSLRFPVWKRIECLSSESRCFWGSVLV